MARGKRKSTASPRSRGAKTRGTKRKLQEQQQQEQQQHKEEETVAAAAAVEEQVEQNENDDSDRRPSNSEEEHQAKRIKSKEFVDDGDLIRLCLDRIASASSSSRSNVRYDASFSERIWHEMTTNRKMTKRLNQYGVLERLLWPQMAKSNEVNDEHVKSIMLLLNDRIHRIGGLRLEDFLGINEHFSDFFARVTALEPQTKDNLILMSNLVSHALSIEQVRSCILSTVSLPLWLQLVESTSRGSEEEQKHQMHHLFNGQPRLLRHFKRLQNKRHELQSHETDYMWRLIRHALQIIEQEHAASEDVDFVVYFLVLMADLMSQVPTRRFLRVVLNQGVHLIVKCHMHAYKFSSNVQYHNAVALLHKFISFPINESTNTPLTLNERIAAQSNKLLRLQQLTFKFFPEKLKELALRNLKRMEDPDVMREQLEKLEDDELVQLCTYLNLFLSPEDSTQRSFLITIILFNVLPPPSFSAQVEGEITFEDYHFVYPTENDLWQEQESNESGNEKLTPNEQLIATTTRMQLTYLSLEHYISSYFALYKQYRSQLFRAKIEDIIPRMQPFFDTHNRRTRFPKRHPDAMPVLMSRIETVGSALVGEEVPSRVVGKIKISLHGLQGDIFAKWNTDWQEQDQLILLSVRVNKRRDKKKDETETTFSDRYTVAFMRTCEVLQVHDQRGNDVLAAGATLFGLDRYLTVKFDGYQYAIDKRAQLASKDRYRQFNLAIRIERSQQSYVLNVLRKIMISEKSVDLWVNDAFLGFQPTVDDGDDDNEREEEYVTVDFGSRIFTSIDHIQETLGEDTFKVVSSVENGNGFKLRFPVGADEEDEDDDSISQPILIDTYHTRSNDTALQSLDMEQIHAIVKIMRLRHGMSLFDCAIASGESIAKIVGTVASLLLTSGSERTLILSGNQNTVDQLTQFTMQDTSLTPLQKNTILTLGREHEHIDVLLQRRLDLLQSVAKMSGYDIQYLSCESAKFFFNTVIEPSWKTFLEKHADDVSFNPEDFPLTPYLQDNETIKTLDDAHVAFDKIRLIFDELDMLRSLELIRHLRKRKIHLQSDMSRVVFSTVQQVQRSLQFSQQRKALLHSFNNIIVVDAHSHFECDLFAVLHELSALDKQLNRVVFMGDSRQDGVMLSEVVLESDGKHLARTIYNDYSLQRSMFNRFMKLKLAPVITMHHISTDQHIHPDLLALWRSLYADSSNDTPQTTEQPSSVSGMKWSFQFIDTPSKFGNIDIEAANMNLGEAEMIVQLYMYMRLCGHESHSIALLTTTHSQKNLIHDVLERRCNHNPLFGPPKTLATITEIRGTVNDIALVSMVHTANKFGILDDSRLLVPMLCHALRGLYMLGSLDHWSTYPHLPSQLGQLVETRGSVLQLENGESIAGVQQLGEKVQDLAKSQIGKLQEQQEQFMERMRELQQQQQQQQQVQMPSLQDQSMEEMEEDKEEEEFIVMADDDDDEQAEEGAEGEEPEEEEESE